VGERKRARHRYRGPVHKYDPKTGEHLCGAPVPQEFTQVVNRTPYHQEGCGSDSPLGRWNAEDYNDDPGAWCCENDDAHVTCLACLSIIGE